MKLPLDYEALLPAFERFIWNEKVIEEMLFLKLLIINMKGLPIFETPKIILWKNIFPFLGSLLLLHVGMPVMGCCWLCGFIANLKSAPGV